MKRNFHDYWALRMNEMPVVEMREWLSKAPPVPIFARLRNLNYGFGF